MWFLFWIQGARFSLAAAALYELKELRYHMDHQAMPNSYFLFKVKKITLCTPF